MLDWRLDASGHAQHRAPDRCPGCRQSRPTLADHPALGQPTSTSAPHLVDRARRPGPPRRRHGTRRSLPGWAQNGMRPDTDTVADVEVWRAAMRSPPSDRRPTGAPQLQKASRALPATAQPAPGRRPHPGAQGMAPPALLELAPQVRSDEFTPLLAERLAAMSRAGVAAHQLLRSAAAAGPLPDEHAAAALWWRMARHLTPAVAAQVGDGSHGEGITTTWSTTARRTPRPRSDRTPRGQHLVARTGQQHRPRTAARLAARRPLARSPPWSTPSRRPAQASTSAWRWCGEPPSRSTPSPTSSESTTTPATSPPRTCGTASSPDPATSRARLDLDPALPPNSNHVEHLGRPTEPARTSTLDRFDPATVERDLLTGTTAAAPAAPSS